MKCHQAKERAHLLLHSTNVDSCPCLTHAWLQAIEYATHENVCVDMRQVAYDNPP